MDTPTPSSRFLLLPEQQQAPANAKQPVLRRYSLARLPALRDDPPRPGWMVPERRHVPKP